MKYRLLLWTSIIALCLCALATGAIRTQAKQGNVPSSPTNEFALPQVEDEREVKGEYLRAFQVAWADIRARDAKQRQKQGEASSPPVEISDFDVTFIGAEPTKQTPDKIVSVAFRRHVTVVPQPRGFSLSGAGFGVVYGVRLSDYKIVGVTLEQ